MKFKEALWNNLLDNGESFRKKDGNQPTDDSTITKINGVYVWSSNGNEEVELSDITLNMVGEIIRADPAVLTAKEKRLEFNMLCCVAPVMQKEIEEYGEEMNKNGQIKEWKRLKKAVDYVKNHTDLFDDLTPPWEPEK